MPVFLQGRHTSIWLQSVRSLKNDPFYWLWIMKKIKKSHRPLVFWILKAVVVTSPLA